MTIRRRAGERPEGRALTERKREREKELQPGRDALPGLTVQRESERLHVSEGEEGEGGGDRVSEWRRRQGREEAGNEVVMGRDRVHHHTSTISTFPVLSLLLLLLSSFFSSSSPV